MVLNKLVAWMRTEARRGPGKGRVARWVGRHWAHLTYARRVEPTWLELNRHPISVYDLPPAFAGFRIVQMSDFHGGKGVRPSYLEEAVDLAQEQKGDVIVLTGDFIHKGFKHVEQVARVLGRLRSPHGVFAVLGNHDFSVRNAMGLRRHPHLHQAVADSLASQGVRVLRNETHAIERSNQRLYLAGVEDLWSRMCDIEGTLAGLCNATPRVILAHNPATIDHLAGRRCDLMLSGHTHGGQVKLPGVGPLALGPKGRRYAAGIYKVEKSTLYVNKGVGFGLRLRYGVRPEVAVFELQPAT